MAMTLYGMLTGIILLTLQCAAALQLNLDDHGCIREQVPLLDRLTNMQHQFKKQQAQSRMA
jgi:hypothetical protein